MQYSTKAFFDYISDLSSLMMSWLAISTSQGSK